MFTGENKIPLNDMLAISTPELMQRCGCGRQTAVEIGTKAKAKLCFGKRILWSVPKIQEYLERISK